MVIRLVRILAVVVAALAVGSAVAVADPDQDQRFLALLDQEHAPAVENVPSIIAAAHRVCVRFDDGTSFDVLRDDMAERSMAANPVERSTPDRVTLAMTRAITAAVEVYCPAHRDLIPG
ncbi:DUF732 domain-containing protein [Mycolicibacter sp. MYC123]|uniref:DUF732 domain-containing protein n=1 Tax=[Mycobacterium] zoologicum TaxID=2872311 RepID=A0ABU5YRY0_9MYCO|nr:MULTISPECIES: DUF732 domain-containing protein [unclassified Mycolicibacter]MEB3051704.1 DUF732 domain-containing protein [Mycolicibacter sp. MYC123]MEB3061215.1 DUF732 domain-containing protein [Mycolicibacter sp. MYC101]